MNRRGLSLAEVVLIVVLVVIVATVLFPMFATSGHICHASTCQSNLQQIGKSIKQYLADWDDTYPTNRCWTSRGKLGPITERVKLSPPGVDAAGKPIRFRYGVNWVEGLYDRIEAITSNKDQSSVWRCPSAGDDTYPEDSDTAAVTYAFNRNLIEKREDVIRNGGNMLLVREIDRRVDAVLRPTNDSSGKPASPPISPLLTKRDARLGDTNPELHAGGSNVLFADSHVKYFERSCFPDDSDLTRKGCWDPETKQWYNYAPGSKMPAKYIRSIAITPWCAGSVPVLYNDERSSRQADP